MKFDQIDTDYLPGGFIIATEKLANGMTKASSRGIEVNSHDPKDAINRLEIQLNELQRTGRLQSEQ